MPSHGNYEITSREDGKVAERDQSYRSCILAMLIFILLCIVLILASLPWRKFQTAPNYPKNQTDSIESAGIKGHGFTTAGTESTITIKEKKPLQDDQPFERYSNVVSSENPEIHETTLQETHEKIEKVQSKVSTSMETFSSPESTTIITSTSETILPFVKKIYESTLENEIASTKDFLSTVEGPNKPVSDDISSVDYSTSLLEKHQLSTEKIDTTRRPIDDYTSLQRLLVAKYFGNESRTTTNENSMDDWLNEMKPSTTRETTELPTSSFTKIVSTNRISTPPTERVTLSTANDTKIEITTSNYMAKSTSVSREIRKLDDDVCESGSCKQLASKILSYMNHSADPCDDFYEYACGGLEVDRQISEKNLLERVYERIEVQARKDSETEFMKYYESCLKYEGSFDIYHRIDLAKESLEKVGKFYTPGNWPGAFQGFTTLFANMLLHNRPLLFDIVPDVNEKNSETFVLKIGPTVGTNPFQEFHTEKMCKEEITETLRDNVDLDHLYETYKNCKKDTSVVVIAISQALRDLGIFEELKNTQNITLYLEDTVTNIYHEIIEGVLTYFPPASEIRESYRSKHYTVTTLGELETTCKLLNWTQLIKTVTGMTLPPNAEFQIYYKDELIRSLRRLEDFSSQHELELNNALLGLYARNIYQDLVATRSSRDLEKKCFKVATHFMKAEASELYMSSFTVNEIQNMKALMRKVFHELRETLRLEFEKSEWAVDWGREVLLKKLSDMRMSIPRVSNSNNNYEYKLNITDNYFENSLSLMKKYRSMLYSILMKNPNDPEQIWTLFASPYQSNSQTIYGLNRIVIPFGAIDWPIFSGNMEKFDYVRLATIGNLIAREIAHNFDANGVRYWNGSRDSEFALMTDDDLTKTNYEDYLSCQRDSIYQEPVEMSLPVTGQRLTFRIPSLTLNDRLSDAVGMRLARDTLARLGKDALEKRLPWLDLNVSQLYYLLYAQTHCTKSSLTSSYVSLYENTLLPSRIRVFVAAGNDKTLGESWKCPEGSQLLPTFTCDVFPHLEYRGVAPDPA